MFRTGAAVTQPSSPQFPVVSIYSAGGPWTVTEGTTQDLSDIFGMHIDLQPGHFYNFFIKYQLSVNGMQGSDSFLPALAFDQPAPLIAVESAASGPGINANAPVKETILDAMSQPITPGMFFFFLPNSYSTTTITSSAQEWQMSTTSTVYLTMDLSNASNPASSVAMSAVVVEVLDFGLVVS
jgi:hypothetical protein